MAEYGPDLSQRQPWELSARTLVSSALVFLLFRTISGSHSVLCLGHLPWMVSTVTTDKRGKLRKQHRKPTGWGDGKSAWRLPRGLSSLYLLLLASWQMGKSREKPLHTWGFPLLLCLSFFFSLDVSLSDIKFHVDQATSTLLCYSWRWPWIDDPVFPTSWMLRLHAWVTPYWDLNSGLSMC